MVGREMAERADGSRGGGGGAALPSGPGYQALTDPPDEGGDDGLEMGSMGQGSYNKTGAG